MIATDATVIHTFTATLSDRSTYAPLSNAETRALEDLSLLRPQEQDRQAWHLQAIARDCIIRLMDDPLGSWGPTTFIADDKTVRIPIMFIVDVIEPAVTEMRWSAEKNLRDVRAGVVKYDRNEPCPCGSGMKYKRCHLGKPDDPISPTGPNPLENTTMADATPVAADVSVDSQTDDKNVFTFTLEAENLTHNPDAWTTEQIAQMERESIEYWKDLPEQQHRALAVISRDCLIRLLENPLEWLPTSMVPASGMRLGMMLYITVDTLEQEVVDMREKAELETYNQIAALADLGQKLEDGADPGTD